MSDRGNLLLALALSVSIHVAVLGLAQTSSANPKHGQDGPLKVLINATGAPAGYAVAKHASQPTLARGGVEKTDTAIANATPPIKTAVRPKPRLNAARTKHRSPVKPSPPKQLATHTQTSARQTVHTKQTQQKPEAPQTPMPTGRTAAAGPDTLAAVAGGSASSPSGMSSVAGSHAGAGGSVHVVSRPDARAHPVYGADPSPAYPARARQLGQSGTVILRLLIGADGHVVKARIDQSSGYPLLDGSALTTVRQEWRFKPGTLNGRPIASWVRVPIRFSIQH